MTASQVIDIFVSTFVGCTPSNMFVGWLRDRKGRR
jgi:hypothetical protein